MSTLKFLKIAALAAFIFTSLASVAQALTYQEIYQAQTQGRVLGASTITLVATASGFINGTALADTTSAMNCTGANFLVAVVGDYENSVVNGASVNDSVGGNTWMHITERSNGVNRHETIYYAANANVGSAQTVTFNAVGTDHTGIAVACYSGVSSSPLDQENGSIPSSLSTTFQPGSLSPSANNELIVAGIMEDEDYFSAINSGFTKQVSNSTSAGVGIHLADLIQTSAVSVNPTWTFTGGGDYGPTSLVAFRPSTFSPTPTSNPTPTPTSTPTPAPIPTSTPSPIPPLGSGTAVIDDFAGCLVTNINPGNPTIITCSKPHGYDNMSASNYVALGSLTNGNTLTVGGTSWTFKTSINNSVPNQILIDVDNTHTMLDLVNAINDTGVGKGTTYSSASSACPNCFALNGGVPSGSFWIYAKTGGSAGESIGISGTGGVEPESNTLIRQIPMQVTGATGAWASMGSNATPRQYTNEVSPSIGRVISATQLSVPFDSTGMAWDGQTGIFIRRASYGDDNELIENTEGEGWANVEAYTPNGLSITVPSCTDNTNDANCSRGFLPFENGKNYGCTGGGQRGGPGDPSVIKSFVVNGSTITITTAGVLANCAGYPTWSAGQLIWVFGYYAYSTNSNPNGFTAQPAALALSSDASTYNCLPINVSQTNNLPQTVPYETCRGFVIQSITTVNGGTQDQITIKNPTDLAGGGASGSGLKNGSYTGTCVTNCPSFTDANGHVVITDYATPYVFFAARSGGYYPPGYGVVGYSKYSPYAIAVANPPAVNRFRTYMLSNINADHVGSQDDFQLGTYAESQGDQLNGDITHYYHDYDPRLYQNQWTMVEATNVPSHRVNENGNGIWPNNPTIQNPYGFGGAGNPPWTYWYGMTSFYLDGPAYTASRVGMSPTYNSFVLDTVPNEPDEWIPNRTVSWSPSRYINGSLMANQGYDVSWTTAPLSNVSYQVRYSTGGSLKTLGFSAGLCENGTTTCNGSDLVSVDPGPVYGGNYEYYWQSSTLPAPNPTVWIAIRPIMPITWAANSGQAYWVGSDLDPMMNAGDHVTVSLSGTTATNVPTTAVMPRQIWYLNAPEDAATWTNPGPLASIQATGGLCQVNLNGVNHNLVPGWKIMVLGTTSATLGAGSDYSGASEYIVSTIVSATQFQFNCPGVPNGLYNSDGSGGHMVVMSYPGVEISGTSPGFTINGTLVSTENNKDFTELVYSPPGASGSIPNPTPTPTPVPTPTPNPVISNLVGSNTTASTTTISWNTDQLTNGQILYGLTSSYTFQSVVVDTNPQTTSHAILFSNLSPSTTYHFSAKSTNSTGQTSQTGDFSFTTLSAPAPTPSPTPSGSPTPTPTGSPTPTGTPVPTPSPTPTPIPVPTTAPAPSGGGGGGGGSPSNPPSPSGGGGGSSSPVVVYIPPSTSTPASPSSPSSSTTRLINIKGTYYLEDNGQLRGITNPGMLASYGFTFAEAQTPTAQDLTLPKGNLLSPGDGSLVKSSQDPTVYLISNQTRYAFTSAKVFSSLGFKFSSVLIVTNPELQILPKGPDISSPASQHLPGTDINNKGTIYWIGQDNQLHGYPSLTTYNSWHIQNDFSTVVPADSADLGLPVGRSVEERGLE